MRLRLQRVSEFSSLGSHPQIPPQEAARLPCPLTPSGRVTVSFLPLPELAGARGLAAPGDQVISSCCYSLAGGAPVVAVTGHRAVDFLLLVSAEETQLMCPLFWLGLTTSRFVLLDFIIILPVLKKTVST